MEFLLHVCIGTLTYLTKALQGNAQMLMHKCWTFFTSYSVESVHFCVHLQTLLTLLPQLTRGAHIQQEKCFDETGEARSNQKMR